MPSKLAPMTVCQVLSAVSILSACAKPASPTLAFPPAADLAVPAKPVPSVEILTSAKASAAHSSAVEAWGDGLALQIGRLCRWAEEMGARGVNCPAR